MLWNPMASLVSLGWLVGLGSFLSGLALLLLAYRLRRLEQILELGFP